MEPNPSLFYLGVGSSLFQLLLVAPFLGQAIPPPIEAASFQASHLVQETGILDHLVLYVENHHPYLMVWALVVAALVLYHQNGEVVDLDGGILLSVHEAYVQPLVVGPAQENLLLGAVGVAHQQRRPHVA